MEQTAHKLVVNPEQSGGIIAVNSKSPKSENLQFTVTTKASKPSNGEGVIQLDVRSPQDGKPFKSPANKSPRPPQRSPSPDMYSSSEGSPSPRRRHGSPAPSFDVSGLANPHKMRRSFREYSPSPSTHRRSHSRSPSVPRKPREPSPKAPEPKPSPGFSTIREEKLYILLTLKRMKGEGVENISDYTLDSNIEEMRLELKTLQDDQMVTNGIENCRVALITVTTGAEILNKKYNPFDLDLDGWSQSIFESIERYDGVLEKLTRKYVKRVAAISPELQLLLMLCGSAASFVFTKSMMKAAMPSMTKVAEDNPELVRKMMASMRPQTEVPTAAAAVPVIPAVVPVVPAAEVPPPRSSRYEEQEPFVRPAPQPPVPSEHSDASDMSLSLDLNSAANDDFSVSSIASPTRKAKPAIKKIDVAGKGSVVRKRNNKVEVNFD